MQPFRVDAGQADKAAADKPKRGGTQPPAGRHDITAVR